MIRFVGNDAEGLPLKRKQSQRACEQCRKRKKRCPHQHTEQYESTVRSADTESFTQPQGANSSASPRPQSQNIAQQARSHSINTSRQPTVQLLSPATANSTASVAAGSNIIDIDEEADEDVDPRFVGELNPEGIFVAGADPTGTATAASAGSPDDVVGIWVPRKLVNAARTLPGPILPILLPYLEGECSRALPNPADYDALYKLYIDEFHPILPILNLSSYQRQQDKNKLFLKLAICLCVASNPRAISHLRKTPKDFTSVVTELLRSVVDNGLVRDKRIITQLLVVLAISTQLSDNRHASAEFTSRAVSYIHTGGLHLDTTSRDDNSHITKLFCCVFALDRLNAAVQGRPVFMHERDIGKDLNVCIEQQDGLFQLFLRVVLLLDNVITLYRPLRISSNESSDDSRTSDLTFPAFEDLLNTCGTIRAPAALVATVETMYHAVAMLSCRSQSLNELSKNSASHTRQSLSATSIMSIVGNEYRGQLSILPFVPYALSLALRVSYRDLRLSKSSFTRTRARRQLLHVCNLLRELGNIFSASIHMVELAEQTVKEMDKAYSNVAGQRRASQFLVASEPGEHKTQGSQATQQQPNDTIGSSTANAEATQELANTSDVVDLPGGHDIQTLDLAQFDFDLDIFDHFDPDFNIEAIDAALANSIDPSMPMDLVRWDSFSNQ